MAQEVKNPPTMQELQEMWVRSLGREDPLEKEWQPTSVFLPGISYGQRNLAGYNPCGHKKVGHSYLTTTKIIFLNKLSTSFSSALGITIILRLSFLMESDCPHKISSFFKP